MIMQRLASHMKDYGRSMDWFEQHARIMPELARFFPLGRPTDKDPIGVFTAGRAVRYCYLLSYYNKMYQ